jgi:hypothetical protein
MAADDQFLPIVHTFTVGDTLDDLIMTFPDPTNNDQDLDMNGMVVKLYYKGIETADTDTEITGAVQVTTTEVKFLCAPLIALGADVYKCQAEFDAASKVNRSDDFGIAVKESVP